MSQTPKAKVSVITPSFNQGKFIEETILSVKNQTYPNIEYIVIDGGSADETLDILRKYNNSLAWFSEMDKGQADAVNKGFKRATGDIIGWLNSDDTYLRDAVEIAVSVLGNNPEIDMIYGDCLIIDEHSQVIGKCPAAPFNFAKLVCGYCMIPQPSVFFRRKVFDEIGYLDTNLHMAMDYDFWIRMVLKCRIAYLPVTLANFRMCVGTKSVEQVAKLHNEQLYILSKLFSSSILPFPKKFRNRAYSNVYMVKGLYAHHLLQDKEARRCFSKAIKLYPLNLFSSPLSCAAIVTSFLGNRATKLAVNLRRDMR